jgi:peptide deformylase
MNTKTDLLSNYTFEGELLDIEVYPAPVLKKVAEAVEVFDEDLHTLCKNMLYTMYKSPGVGLAAPQVGISKRLFVMDVSYSREEITTADGSTRFEYADFSPEVFINPVIKDKRGEIVYEEGCLSLPGLYEDVKRSEFIRVEYLDMFGEKHELEADGLFSICLQHENDHLDGVIFLERLSLLKKKILTKKFLKQNKK